MRMLLAVVALVGLSGCASIQPSVKAVCGVCTTMCPLISGLRAVPCVEGKRLVVVNWKAVEAGAEPKVECR